MSIERTPTNDQIAAVLLQTGNPTDEQKEQLAEYLGRAPAPEKAAPIPAEVRALAWRVVDTLWMSSHEKTDARRTIEREVMALLADRASQEVRVREDEREALARHMAAEYAQHETGYDWELTDRIWQEGWRKAADRALAAIDAALIPEAPAS